MFFNMKNKIENRFTEKIAYVSLGREITWLQGQTNLVKIGAWMAQYGAGKQGDLKLTHMPN